MVEHCLLAGSLAHVQLPSCLGNSTAHSGHDPPISIKNKDNPQTCPSTNIIWVVPQERLPSQVSLESHIGLLKVLSNLKSYIQESSGHIFHLLKDGGP